MDLHDRVMQVLNGRIKMGAGAGGKKKKPGPKKASTKKAPTRKAAPKKKPSKKGGIHAGIEAGIMAGGKSKKKAAAGRKTAKTSDWVKYVKEWAKLNNVSYGCAMADAGPSYRAWKGI